jgi:hypothetical protein
MSYSATLARWAPHNGHIRRAAHGYEPTREAAMAAFAKSWRREKTCEHFAKSIFRLP